MFSFVAEQLAVKSIEMILTVTGNRVHVDNAHIVHVDNAHRKNVLGTQLRYVRLAAIIMAYNVSKQAFPRNTLMWLTL